MSKFEIKMPKLGESITEGTIMKWSVKKGDVIQEDEVLFEVSTAKVSAEIPSPVAGTLVEILVQEGETAPVGAVVALVLLEGETDDSAKVHFVDDVLTSIGVVQMVVACLEDIVAVGFQLELVILERLPGEGCVEIA